MTQRAHLATWPSPQLRQWCPTSTRRRRLSMWMRMRAMWRSTVRSRTMTVSCMPPIKHSCAIPCHSVPFQPNTMLFSGIATRRWSWTASSRWSTSISWTANSCSMCRWPMQRVTSSTARCSPRVCGAPSPLSWDQRQPAHSQTRRRLAPARRQPSAGPQPWSASSSAHLSLHSFKETASLQCGTHLPNECTTGTRTYWTAHNQGRACIQIVKPELISH